MQSDREYELRTKIDVEVKRSAGATQRLKALTHTQAYAALPGVTFARGTAAKLDDMLADVREKCKTLKRRLT